MEKDDLGCRAVVIPVLCIVFAFLFFLATDLKRSRRHNVPVAPCCPPNCPREK